MITAETRKLSEFTRAVRESTLKRLMAVPEGMENWQPDDEAMSFADIAYHIIQADLWLFEKINNPALEAFQGQAGQAHIETRDQYENLIERLEKLGRERANFIINLGEAKMDEMIYDERFGGEVSIWWMIVRGNLDHEIHHRGQISAYLRMALRGKEKV